MRDPGVWPRRPPRLHAPTGLGAVWSGAQIDRLPLGRGTGADVGPYLLDYRRLRHEGDDTHFDVAGRAPDQVDLEGLLQERRPSADVSGFGIVRGSD